MRVSIRLIWLAALAAIVSCAVNAQEVFPRPAALEPDIAFWTRVYTEIDTNSGFIHDSRHLGVVYRTVHFPDGATGRARNRVLRAAYDELRTILDRLASGKREGLSAEEQRVLDAWPADVSNAELRAARGRLRFQLGQANRFRSGLIRSGIWRSYIESVLERQGLPPELAALPHVESSFDPTAYSKVGAAGMWQFTRSTGLRYMRIDHIVDERRDPFFSTIAAARLLRNNFDVLGSWPLALTAYNHGVAGMRQAVQQQKTKDIETILRNYDGRTFGFASRNFYVAFLAAVDVDRDPERYFGPLTESPPANTVTVTVPDYMTVDALESTLDIDRRQLRYWNPALTEAVWSGDKFVPRGFELRLPAMLGADPAVRLAAIPATQRYTAQMPDIYHRVGRGDTISQIAARYGVSINSLVELNGLRSRNFIRAGQVLRLPGNGSTTPVTLARLESPGDTSTYVVRAGDSIAQIARRFGVAEDLLLAQNRITDRNLIYAGQELRIAGDVDAGLEPVVADVSFESDTADEIPQTLVEPVASAEPAGVDVGAAQVVMPDDSAIATVAAAFSSAEELSRVDALRLLASDATVAMLSGANVDGNLEPALEPDFEPDFESGLADGDLEPDVQSGLTPGFSVDIAPGLEIDLRAELTTDPAPASAEAVTENAQLSAETALDTNVLSSEQADMAADPSDYLVAADNTIEVQALETLGHYAEWLGIRTQRLRDINDLPFGQAVVIGERLKLEFGEVDAATFEQRRIAYQQSTQEAFFLAYRITDTVEHVIRPGESLWVLALRRYRVPVWLVRQFNPDLDLDRVNPGTVVKFPELRPIAAGGQPAQAAYESQ